MKHSIEQEVNGFRRILILHPPFDKTAENYGIHGADLTMVLCKDVRAVQFKAFLPVYLPHVVDNLTSTMHKLYNPFKGMGADVGYHSPYPMFEDHQPIEDDCEFTGGKCYYDGSSLRAERWYKEWLEKGCDAIWRKLEVEWKDRFNEVSEKSCKETKT